MKEVVLGKGFVMIVKPSDGRDCSYPGAQFRGEETLWGKPPTPEEALEIKKYYDGLARDQKYIEKAKKAIAEGRLEDPRIRRTKPVVNPWSKK